MGGAVAAAAQGPEALFQNPAGLLTNGAAGSEAAFGYDALGGTLYQGAAAYSRPCGDAGRCALGVESISQAPQTAYDVLGNSTGQFTPVDLAAAGAYARRWTAVDVGGSAKFVRSSIADRSGTTFAIGVGAIWRDAAELGAGPVDCGIAANNFGPPLKVGSSADPLPFVLRGGTKWRVSALVDVALDLAFPADADPSINLGAEARLPSATLGSADRWTASLRVGWNQSRSRGIDGFSGAALGAGLDIRAVRVDYAWLALGSLGSSNRITVAVRF